MTHPAVVFDYPIINFGGARPPVAVIQRRYRLAQYLPYKVLPNRVVRLAAPPNELLEVAAVAVLHDDVDFGSLLVDDAVVVLDDVVVGEFTQYIHLRHNLLLLLLAHDPIVQLLPHKYFLVADSAHFLDFAEGSCDRKIESVGCFF